MKKITSKQIIPVCTSLVAIVFIVLAITEYGFWGGKKGPLPGFVPLIIASALLVASILSLLQSFKEEGPTYPAANWMAVLGAACVIGATFIIGMIPSIAIYVVIWLKLYEKLSWKNTLLVWLVIMSIVLGVFVLWLGVPFPEGMLVEMIAG
ncbi:MAG: tripartite tricarboxylate transporter TctB [Anaerotruncus sp.]|nr:tripartite tricarboxylate transporter TctB [Anaerotruncus sp.]